MCLQPARKHSLVANKQNMYPLEYWELICKLPCTYKDILLPGFVCFSSASQLFNTKKSSLDCSSIFFKHHCLCISTNLARNEYPKLFSNHCLQMSGLMKGMPTMMSLNLLATTLAATLLFLVTPTRQEYCAT